MKNSKKAHIAVCVGTHNRPDSLANTLQSLIKLEVPNDTDISVIVIDNNRVETSEQVVLGLKQRSKFNLLYIHEEEIGIVHMRNRALTEASHIGATHLAFIDDDEIASTHWIKELYDALIRYEAQVVQGTTERVLPEGTPNWLIKSNILQLKRHSTGQIRTSAGTRNVLFDLRFINQHNLRFNPVFNFMGSSDSFFFHQAYLKGAKIVWVDEARVKEILPQNRVDVGWIIQRSFRMGVTDFEMKKQLGAYFSILNSLLMYILYLFLFAILSMLTLPFNRGISLKLFLQMAKAAGFLYKMAGFTYLEYKTIE